MEGVILILFLIELIDSWVLEIFYSLIIILSLLLSLFSLLSKV